MAVSTFVAASVVGTVASIQQQKKVQEASKQQAAVSSAQQGEQASRARRTSVREAMVKRAQIENVAGATGQIQSSAPIVSGAGVSGQTNENLGNINKSLALSAAATRAQGQMNRAQQASPLQIISGTVQQGSAPFIQ